MKKTINRKGELLETARNIIQRVGVNAMSYADLSKIIGITTASIHHHFPRKEDLILSLIAQSREIYGNKFQEIVGSDLTSIEKLQTIAGLYEQGVRMGKMCLIGILSTEFATLGDDVRAALNVSASETIGTFARAVQMGIDAGEIAPGKRSSREIAQAFHSTLLGAQIQARCSGNLEAFENSVEVFIESIRKK